MADVILEPNHPPFPTADLEASPTPTKIKGPDLFNLLNYINFQEGTIFARFGDPRSPRVLSFQAFPQPTKDGTVVCQWLAPGIPPSLLESLQFENFLVSDGKSYVTIPAEVQSLDGHQATFRIPEFGWETSVRKVIRHAVVDVGVRLFQNGVSLEGRAIEFHAFAVRIEVHPSREGDVDLVNKEAPVFVIVQKGDRVLFSGECLVLRHHSAPEGETFVVAPHFNNIRRFPSTQFRTLRHVLSPAPQVTFVHPLTTKTVTLPVSDLSGAGFSVEEFFDSARLIPGLFLDGIELRFGNRTLLRCSGQVLYRNDCPTEGTREVVRYGVVFLGMNLPDQAQLAALLHQKMNGCLRVCSAVDQDELWKFFFETGFFYPSKYLAVEPSKEEFKAVFEKLYLQSPSISRHFLFQDKGTLFAHLSMIRAYPEAWLIHHHAASKDGHALAGVAVLDQINHYINEFHRHRSTHMKFVLCYYREENRFPHRVFGGSYRDVGDRKGISVDKFAYLPVPEASGSGTEASFQLFPASRDDLAELRSFYERVSGGLALSALNLDDLAVSEDELNQQYSILGFRRDHRLFSVKQDGALKAVLSVSLSEPGINLSNLTNCLHAFILDRDHLDPGVLFAALHNLRSHFQTGEVPLMLYPAEWLRERDIAFEKEYILWILAMHHNDGFVRSLRSKFRGHHGDS